MSVDRRDFLKATAAGIAAGTLIPRAAVAAGGRTTIHVVHGTDVRKMLAEGMAARGGFGAIVKPGKKATVKPNAAWASRPEQGGNTDPVLVGAVVAACKAAGAAEVVVPENSVGSHSRTFAMSGIRAAVEGAGGRMYRPENDGHFRAVDIPGGRVLKRAEVAVDVLDTGCLINVPVAKSHSASVLTLSMKNWMGSVKDRMVWHRGKLDQCIADCSTLIRPALIIVDATRIMLTGGPRGPGEMAQPNQLVFGSDPVAVDAYAATLFGKRPFDVPHIRIADEMGIGIGDLTRVEVMNIHVD